MFCDQEFSADMVGTDRGRAVERIDDVRLLRQAQFPEDAGPMAHSVRPNSYVDSNNFYTVTIYEKGAEVVRMYQTLFDRDDFRMCMDLYFERWYSQAGAPWLQAQAKYDPTKKTYELTLSQTCAQISWQAKKLPPHILVGVGLFDSTGKDMPLPLSTDTKRKVAGDTTCVLELTKAQQTFHFADVA